MRNKILKVSRMPLISFPQTWNNIDDSVKSIEPNLSVKLSCRLWIIMPTSNAMKQPALVASLATKSSTHYKNGFIQFT